MLFVRGNADRSVTELAERLQDPGAEATPRERWMVEQHDAPMRALLAAFPATVELEVDGLGDVLFCHGSPRSDEELVTVETPESRLADAVAGTSAAVDRDGAHARQIRAAAARTDVLQPRQRRHAVRGRAGCLLGAARRRRHRHGHGSSPIEHRRTAYDLDETERRYRESGDPMAAEMIEILRQPPTPAEVIAHAESLAFSG